MPVTRTRPSLFTPIAGPLLGCMGATVQSILGEQKAQVMLYGLEKAIQDENDEQLRILNDLKIDAGIDTEEDK